MWQTTCIAFAVAAGSALSAPGGPATSPIIEPTPATAPASQPAEADTPKDALKILAAAMRDGDADKLKSVVLTSSPSEVRMLGAMAAVAGSLARLNQAAVKAFGEEDASRFTDDSAAHFSETLARIDAAEVTIDGDKAKVRYHDSGQVPFQMRRIPAGHASQEGLWKVPMSELSPGADAAALDQRLGELNVERKILDELAEEIAAGKYKNAEAGKEAWRGKIMQILPSHPPATAPSGGPATRTGGAEH